MSDDGAATWTEYAAARVVGGQPTALDSHPHVRREAELLADLLDELTTHGDDITCGKLCDASDVLRAALAGQLSSVTEHGLRWTGEAPDDFVAVENGVTWFNDPETPRRHRAIWAEGGHPSQLVARTVYYGPTHPVDTEEGA